MERRRNVSFSRAGAHACDRKWRMRKLKEVEEQSQERREQRKRVSKKRGVRGRGARDGNYFLMRERVVREREKENHSLSSHWL